MITEFTIYQLTIQGHAANTAKAYAKDLVSFVSYIKLHKQDARWSTITKDDVEAYMTYLANGGMQPASRNRHLAAIGQLYNYMKYKGYDVENPARFIPRAKIAQKVPNTIPVEDLKKAIKHSTGDIAIIIETLLTTGIRIQELLDMKTEDLDAMNNLIKIHGKGMKERLVYTTAENMRNLVRYANGTKGWLFGHLTQEQVRQDIYDSLKNISQAPQLSPHAIRHTFSTEMAKNGINTSSLAQILGHNSIRTTQRYIDFGQQQASAAYSRYQTFA